MSNKAQEFAKLNEKRKELETRKITLEVKFKEAQKSLQQVVSEIKEAGYDPKTLAAELKAKEEELEKAQKDFEEKLEIAERLITEIEQAAGI